MDARVRQVAVAALLVGALGLTPGALLATLSDSPRPAVSTLQDLRERTAKRQALVRELSVQVGELGTEIAAQKKVRGEHEASFAAARQRLAQLERTLDHLVPRLLAQEAVVEARRGRATRALARLADVSREVDIAPELRARLLAVSPMMLDRLRGAEASAAVLRDEAARRSAEYRELLAQAPALLEARQRAEQLREQAERRRTAIQDRLAGLRTELAALDVEQERLAQKLIARESAELVRVDPQADEPIRAQATQDRLPEAAVKGEVSLDQVVAEVMATDRAGGAPRRARATTPRAALSADADVRTVIGPPPAKPRGVDTPAAGSVTSGLASLSGPIDEASPTIRSHLSALVEAARLEAPGGPVLPVPGEVIEGGQPRLVRGDEAPSLVIEARAGQVVAAPDRGRIVFAGRFKRYGLLLMIEHSADYHTLLWGFAELRVQRGDRVRAGQMVGVLGASEGIVPNLHMEVRRNGEPVNPLLWMAASNSKVQG